MKNLLLAALAALVVTAIAPLATARAASPSDETSFVTQINDLRATKGLPTLDVDAGLTVKARAWAQTMANGGSIWHSDLADGISANWQKLGENVGVGGSVDSLHTAFVNSPRHYENLVDPNFRAIGVGVVRTADRLYVAEEFMQLRGPAAVATTPVTSIAPAMKPAAVKPAAVKTPAVKTAAVEIPAAPAPKPPAPVAPSPAGEISPMDWPHERWPRSGDAQRSIW